jgi:hypothetical protein
LNRTAAIASSSKSKNNDNKTIQQQQQQKGFTKRSTLKSIPFVLLPDRKGAWKLMLFSGPIFFVIVSNIACYSAMPLQCTNFGVDISSPFNYDENIFLLWMFW